MRMPAREERDPGGERARQRDVGAVEPCAVVGEGGEVGRRPWIEAIGAQRVGGEDEDIWARVAGGGARGRDRDGEERDGEGGTADRADVGETATGARQACGPLVPARRRPGEEHRDPHEREEDYASRAEARRSRGPARPPAVPPRAYHASA